MNSSDLIKYAGKTVDDVILELQEKEKESKRIQSTLEQFIKNQKGKYFKVIHNQNGASYYHIIDEKLLALQISVYSTIYREENSRFNYLWFNIPEIGQTCSYGVIVKEISKELFEDVQSVKQFFIKYIQ